MTSSPFSHSLNETYNRLSNKYNMKPNLPTEKIKSTLKSNMIIIGPILAVVIIFFIYKKFKK